MLDYLLNDLYFLWNKESLVHATQEILNHNFTEGGIETVIQGKCF